MICMDRRSVVCSLGLLSLVVSLAGQACRAGAPVPATASPAGRWVTASGNLEVDIAPCGRALCGTVTKVLANQSMSGSGEEMHPVDTRPALGMQLLKDFMPEPHDEGAAITEWAGEIYNRENGKTYRCKMSVSTATQAEGELVLRAYVGIPLFGKTQVWHRVAGSQDSPAPQIDQTAGSAPEFVGISQWHNSPPLSMAGLRGKVVLVDFWALGCGNCINTLPQVERWHQRYQSRGLVVVGVHTPEFEAERAVEAVRSAVRRYGLHYPVAQDNAYRTWGAWHNQYWPALYLVNRDGRVVYQHVGEGDYEQIEQQIQQALR